MRQIFIAALLAAAPLGSAHALDVGEFAACGSSHGTIESVREVESAERVAEPPNVIEHAINPETVDEVVVRLRDGRGVTVLEDGGPSFKPGQRVCVIDDGRGGRIEPVS